MINLYMAAMELFKVADSSIMPTSANYSFSYHPSTLGAAKC